MSASGTLFIQERDFEAQKEEQNLKLTTWTRLTSKKKLTKSTKRKSI